MINFKKRLVEMIQMFSHQLDFQEKFLKLNIQMSLEDTPKPGSMMVYRMPRPIIRKIKTIS